MAGLLGHTVVDFSHTLVDLVVRLLCLGVMMVFLPFELAVPLLFVGSLDPIGSPAHVRMDSLI